MYLCVLVCCVCVCCVYVLLACWLFAGHLHEGVGLGLGAAGRLLGNSYNYIRTISLQYVMLYCSVVQYSRISYHQNRLCYYIMCRLLDGMIVVLDWFIVVV